MNNKRKKIGLALGSGGIKGYAHIGVIQTLLKHNIPIDYIAGSSAGAWIGTYYALYQDIEKLKNFMIEEKELIIRAMLEPSLTGGFIKGIKIEKFLESMLDNSEFADTKIPMRVVATDLETGEPVVFSEGELASPLRASIAIPSIFRPIQYQGMILIDGAISNMVPDDVVKKMGADIVISVNLENHKQPNSFDPNHLGIARVTERSINLLLHNLAKHSTLDSDIIINPINCYDGITGWKKYVSEPIERENILRGIEAAERKIDDIKKILVS